MHIDNVLVVGGPVSAANLAARIRNRPDSGLRVTGLCLPREKTAADETRCSQIDGFPVVGTLDDLLGAVQATRADLVAVTASESLPAEDIRRLAWELEGTGVSWAFAPELTDVAQPRIRVKRVADVPLVHVVEPTFHGPKLIAKTALDFTVALSALCLLTPVLLLVGLIIKAYDGGPVFFRQERVGLAGRRFRIVKFRSMTDGSQLKLKEASIATRQTGPVFYKVPDDPRITPIGRVIRRTSIDELPQLFNVIAGHMSIVGPRPLVPGEGAEILSFVERRMLVKPGITGLWQVSGRSALSAEERIRLDFYYVENWSLANDLMLMVRTIGVVVSRRGAY